jgi:hypothetical protein
METEDRANRNDSIKEIEKLAALLHETDEGHDRFEKTHAGHQWWDWYAAYLSTRLNGGSTEAATSVADSYMEDVLHIQRL